MTHKELVRAYYDNEVTIGVDPAVARRFFTDADFKAVEDKIGEPLYLEPFLTRLLWFGSYLLTIIVSILLFISFGYYGLILVPVFILFCLFKFGRSSMGMASILYPFLGVIVSIIVAFVYLDGFRALTVCLLFAPWLMATIEYRCATTFFRNLVIRNEKAHKLLNDEIVAKNL